MSRFLLAALTILLTISCAHSIPIEPTVSTPIPPIEPHPPSAIDGSLLAITREKIGTTPADLVKSISHTIAPHAQAKAAEFVAQLDRLVEGFKAKSHIARLKNKYTKKNVTLSHAIEHDAIDSHSQEDDQHDNLAAHQEAAATMEDGASQFEPLPSHMDESNANSHFPKPTLLEPVPSKRRRAKRHLVEDKEYVLYSIQLPPTQPSPSGFNFTSFIYPTPEGNVTIYVGITEYPLGKFHFYPSPRDQLDDISLSEAAASSPMKGPLKASALSPMRKRLFPSFLETAAQVQFNSLCDGVATTSVSANSYGCIFAQNAGFFNVETHACMGNVVSDDQYINHAAAGLKGRPHFGFTRKGNFITGYLTVTEAANGVDGGFHELTQGQGWLIRDGRNYLEQSVIHENLDSGFVTEKAPRNAIGHDSQGRLLMFQADGEEDIKLGLTLPEFADILAHHFKVENAINVDGGGSSTTVYKGQVVDKPTCRDTPEICERPVTTISCVLP